MHVLIPAVARLTGCQAVHYGQINVTQVHIDLTGSPQPEDTPDGILPSTLGNISILVLCLTQMLDTCLELLSPLFAQLRA